MSHGLAPSRSTVYVSNLPFELKNNDLHKIFEKHGKLVKVTVLKDKQMRKSKGVAFLLYLNKEDAMKCVEATNMQEMFGRTLKASIAKDNGRSTEFIRKRVYADKSFCYECGEEGHLSYACDKNLLGTRDPPPKKTRKRKIEKSKSKNDYSCYDSDENQYDETLKCAEEDDDETLSAAIAAEQEKHSSDHKEESTCVKRKRFVKSAYFSDEEDVE